MWQSMFRFAPALVLVLSIACSDDVAAPVDTEDRTPQTLTSLRIHPGQALLLPGDTAQLTAVPLDQGGNAMDTTLVISWSSSGEAAVVSEDGVVTAVAPGRASVTAMAGELSDTVPVEVMVAFEGVAASLTAICGLVVDGSLYCAGDSYGPTPQLLAGDLRFRSITGFGRISPTGDTGTNQAGFCALTEDNRAYCWGTNANGQLGVGDTQARDQPTPVAANLEFESLSPSVSHTCGITVQGEAYCWGNGGTGALGNGTDLDSAIPARVLTEVRFSQISTGQRYSCGLAAGGTMHCWGHNLLGQLANGANPENSNTPVRAAVGQTFGVLSQGNTNFTCALDRAGKAHCWGNSNPFGNSVQHSQCPLPGGGTHGCWPQPTALETPLRFVSLVANELAGMCGLTANGDVACWGVNVNGRFGQDEQVCPPTNGCGRPQAGPGGLGFVALAGSAATNCGLTSTGRVYCWGDNTHGQLGNPSAQEVSLTPKPFVAVPAAR